MDLPSDNELPDIILLAQVEELPDLGGSLGAETLGEDGVGKAGNVVLTLLNDDNGENGNVGSDDASTNGLSASVLLLPTLPCIRQG
jgi:hypothetical protein